MLPKTISEFERLDTSGRGILKPIAISSGTTSVIRSASAASAVENTCNSSSAIELRLDHSSRRVGLRDHRTSGVIHITHFIRLTVRSLGCVLYSAQLVIFVIKVT